MATRDDVAVSRLLGSKSCYFWMPMPAELPRAIGRYSLHGKLASGGMASVHLGRVEGAAGFARTVAIKRLHPVLAEDPDFAAMFVTEARVAARIKHPNVVPTLDVVQQDGELFLVMEYIEGEALSNLIRLAKGDVPINIAISIVVGALRGLHAAHNATNEQGERLDIVHRDVSPQNIIVGSDGIPRVLDFGVAKAVGYGNPTRTGHLKGKIGYFAPEQMESKAPTLHLDVFASGVVLWEALAGRRLFSADNEAATLARVMALDVPPVSSVRPGVPAAVDAVIAKALQRDPANRFQSAQEMADALEDASSPASSRTIARWVHEVAGTRMAQRAAAVAEVERGGTTTPIVVPPPPPSIADASSAAVVLPKNKPIFALGALGVVLIAVGVVIVVFMLRAPRSTTPATSDSPRATASAASTVPTVPDVSSVAVVQSTGLAPSTTGSPHAAAAHTPLSSYPRSIPHPSASSAPTTASSAQTDGGKTPLYGRD